jgi:phosphotransferase system HPr (HPr) family protein
MAESIVFLPTMQMRQAIIANTQGIHCRPSAVIVKEFQGYSGKIRISNDHGSCDVSSVMQLLSLEMHLGSKVKIEVMGENDIATADRLVELFQTHFDFPPL